VTRPGGTVYVSARANGVTEWSDTVHGRRWFYVWDVDAFVAAVGLDVTDVTVGAVFLEVWATRP
jgi:hypothetical protein